MKKNLLLVSLLIMTLLLTGCGSDKETTKTDNNKETNTTSDSIKDSVTEESKVLKCTRNATVSEGVRMELSYKATYKGDYVELIETEEKIISNNSAVLEAYKSNVEKMYSPYKNVEHYNYNVVIDDDTLISTTHIDYSKIDTEKLIEIDSANKTLIKNGKVKISDVKLMYQTVGATCE